MTKLKLSKTALLKLSLALNALLIIGGMAYFALTSYANQNLELAEFNALQQSICGQHYNQYLNARPTEQSKKAFAIDACLRNYKTGQDLDLTPLEAQIH